MLILLAPLLIFIQKMPHYYNQCITPWDHCNSLLTGPCFHPGPLLPLPSRASTRAPLTHKFMPSLLGSKCHCGARSTWSWSWSLEWPMACTQYAFSLPASFRPGWPHLCLQPSALDFVHHLSDHSLTPFKTWLRHSSEAPPA